MEMYDLIVVGLGPAGLKASGVALKNGLKTLAFEKNNIGGCCLNKGCVPTKAILHSSDLYFEIQNSKKFGINVESGVTFDFNQIIENKNTIVQKLSKAAESELIKKGLEIIKEEAVIDYENLTVNGKVAKNILISTGSIPFELSNLPFDGVNILSSDDILNMTTLPKSIAIIGTGAIGVEWARIFSNFNVDVTVIEKAPTILPLMDVDIQKRLNRILRQKKVKIITGQGATSFKNGVLTLESGQTVEVEKVLVAVGRKRVIPNGLQINPDLTTNYKNIYVSGDISSKKMLAHTASMEANFVMNKILNKTSVLVKNTDIPSVIYGTPEAASVGLNEQDTDETYKIHNLPVSFLAKSWCDGQIDGFIKIITKDSLIKGAHIVSNEASSLITAIQVMMNKEFKLNEIENLVFAHPTYSEGILEAILNG